MSEQLEFDLPGGQRARDIGIARAAGAPRGRIWRAEAEKVLDRLIVKGRPFTADDVVRAVGFLPGSGANESNAVGALFAAYSRRGEIKAVGSAQTARRVGHGRRMTLWIGTA